MLKTNFPYLPMCPNGDFTLQIRRIRPWLWSFAAKPKRPIRRHAQCPAALPPPLPGVCPVRDDPTAPSRADKAPASKKTAVSAGLWFKWWRIKSSPLERSLSVRLELRSSPTAWWTLLYFSLYSIMRLWWNGSAVQNNCKRRRNFQ